MKNFVSPNNPDLKLSTLYPTPGKLHGSRKRRAYSSHGPHSVSTPVHNDPDHECFEPPINETNETEITIEGDSSIVRPPQTPVPTSTTGLESVLRTPVCDNSSHKTGSPISNEMSLFRHLSLRSPGRLSKSPGSSFSQYTKCEKVTGMLSSTAHSFDSSECSITTGSHSQIYPPSVNATNMTRMVPLTVLSDTFTPTGGNINTVTMDQKYGKGFSPGMSKPPFHSPNKMSSPRAISKSRFFPSPKSRSFLPSPRQDSQETSVNQAAIVSQEKLPEENKHVLWTQFPDLDGSPIAPQRLMKDHFTFSPPLSFVSIDHTNSKKNSINFSEVKRRSLVHTRSMLKPDSHQSNQELNAMLHIDEDINGSLSDSDSESGDAFFLEDPSRLTLSRRPKMKKPNEESGESSDFNLSLAAAYSFMNKKKKVLDERGSNTSNEQNSLNEHSKDLKLQQSNQSSFFDDNKEGNGSSTTSLFGMNIIQENSVSNGSLFELNAPFLSRKNSSSKNLDDTSSSSTSIFKRTKSDQSFLSIGLCIEDSMLGCSYEYSKRDLITPPVNSRTMSSPPPLKQTKLLANDN